MSITLDTAKSLIKKAGFGSRKGMAAEFMAAYNLYTEHYNPHETDELTALLLDMYLCGREDENNRVSNLIYGTAKKVSYGV